jgi:hypothetical protein
VRLSRAPGCRGNWTSVPSATGSRFVRQTSCRDRIRTQGDLTLDSVILWTGCQEHSAAGGNRLQRRRARPETGHRARIGESAVELDASPSGAGRRPRHHRPQCRHEPVSLCPNATSSSCRAWRWQPEAGHSAAIDQQLIQATVPFVALQNRVISAGEQS